MLMITLRLTLSELDLLRHLLSAQPHDETAAFVFVNRKSRQLIVENRGSGVNWENE